MRNCAFFLLALNLLEFYQNTDTNHRQTAAATWPGTARVNHNFKLRNSVSVSFQGAVPTHVDSTASGSDRQATNQRKEGALIQPVHVLVVLVLAPQ